MRIPVFVSCPTALSPDQNEIRKMILDLLNDIRFEPRALGRSDYPKDVPLKEVYVIARHCHGGLILEWRGSGLELSVILHARDDLAHGRVMNPQESANRAEGITVFDMRCNDRPVSFITSGPMEEFL